VKGVGPVNGISCAGNKKSAGHADAFALRHVIISIGFTPSPR
jgi:hypothetical protein